MKHSHLSSLIIIFIAEQILWTNSWSEEWVVLYDDSTMAWFTVSFITKSCCCLSEYGRNDTSALQMMVKFSLVLPRYPNLAFDMKTNFLQLAAFGSGAGWRKLQYWSSQAKLKRKASLVICHKRHTEHILLLLSAVFRKRKALQTYMTKLFTKGIKHSTSIPIYVCSYNWWMILFLVYAELPSSYVNSPLLRHSSWQKICRLQEEIQNQ